MIRAGKYRHRIVIEAPQNSTGSEGQNVVLWVDAYPDATALGGIPAEVLTGPGREFRASDGPNSELAARINIRPLPGLHQRMRVLWDGKVYGIQSIETDETARREMRLRCTAGVNSGE